MADIVRMLEEHFRLARSVVMEGAAHQPDMEKPREFNRVVLEFLDQA